MRSLKVEIIINSADAQRRLQEIVQDYDNGLCEISDMATLTQTVRDLLKIDVILTPIPSTITTDFVGLVTRVTYGDNGEAPKVEILGQSEGDA